jgi:hypothetical protein
VLQYLLGLRSLGHDVWFIDQLSPDATAVDAKRSESDIAFCSRVMADAGFGDRFGVLDTPGGRCRPIERARLRQITETADVLLNLSGRLADPDVYGHIPVRVFVDLDPGFNQLWAQQGVDLNLDCHTHFATLGWELGAQSCAVPLLGRSWIKFRPPVALGVWPVQSNEPKYGFTTIGNWRSYGPIWRGEFRLGLKAHSFRALLDLPSLTPAKLSVALRIHPGDSHDLVALRQAGWTVLDGGSVAATVDDYSAFIGSSEGEIAVAKEGYVITQCGWFSERSAAYLASGRPVVAQATGFEHELPTGAGLVAFTNSAEGAAKIHEVQGRYKWHARHARELAEHHFSAERVLARLMDEVYAPLAAPHP